jgi:hypothetical protein
MANQNRELKPYRGSHPRTVGIIGETIGAVISRYNGDGTVLGPSNNLPRARVAHPYDPRYWNWVERHHRWGSP